MKFSRRSLPVRLRTVIYNIVATADRGLTEEEVFQAVGTAADESGQPIAMYDSGVVKGDRPTFRKRQPSRRLKRLILKELVAEDKIRMIEPRPALYIRGRGPGRTSLGWGVDEAKLSNIHQWLPDEQPTRAERLEEVFHDALVALVERLGRAVTRDEWFHIAIGGKATERRAAFTMLLSCARVGRSGLGVRGNPFRYLPLETRS